MIVGNKLRNPLHDRFLIVTLVRAPYRPLGLVLSPSWLVWKTVPKFGDGGITGVT